MVWNKWQIGSHKKQPENAKHLGGEFAAYFDIKDRIW
jgi:hypothetical protein